MPIYNAIVGKTIISVKVITIANIIIYIVFMISNNLLKYMFLWILDYKIV